MSWISSLEAPKDACTELTSEHHHLSCGHTIYVAAATQAHGQKGPCRANCSHVAEALKAWQPTADVDPNNPDLAFAGSANNASHAGINEPTGPITTSKGLIISTLLTAEAKYLCIPCHQLMWMTEISVPYREARKLAESRDPTLQLWTSKNRFDFLMGTPDMVAAERVVMEKVKGKVREEKRTGAVAGWGLDHQVEGAEKGSGLDVDELGAMMQRDAVVSEEAGVENLEREMRWAGM